MIILRKSAYLETSVYLEKSAYLGKWRSVLIMRVHSIFRYEVSYRNSKLLSIYSTNARKLFNGEIQKLSIMMSLLRLINFH